MAKLSYNHVKDYFEEHGCELLENEYKNAHVKMRYKCSCENIAEINFNNFKSGRRCKKCATQRQADKRRFSQEYVAKVFEDNGCELIGDYKQALSKVEYLCECGEKAEISLADFQNGKRCGKCRYKKISNKLKHDYEYVKGFFEDNNCILLEEKYTNAHIPMSYICECKRVSLICFDSFRLGNRCKKCGIEKMAEKQRGPNHYAWIEDRELKKENDILKGKCSSMVRRLLVDKKTNRSHEILGYSHKDLRERMESFPEWENLKKDTWHLDHIFPITAFFKYGIRRIDVISDLDNLQPLSPIDNIIKSDYYDAEEFENYLERKYSKAWQRILK